MSYEPTLVNEVSTICVSEWDNEELLVCKGAIPGQARAVGETENDYARLR